MLINKNTRIILIVLTAILILITGVSIYQGIYYSDNNVAKRFLNNTQEKYNVKLPQEINVEYKYLDSAIDGSNTYFVLTIQEDYELWSKAIGVINVANIPEVLGRYRVSGDSITEKKKNQLAGFETNLIKNNIYNYFKIKLTKKQYQLIQKRLIFYWDLSVKDRIAYQKELKKLYLKIEKQNKKIKFINPNNMYEALKKSWILTCGDENLVYSKYAPPYKGDFEKIFSIATSNNGTHKVLTIFGLKLKWRIK